MINSLNSTQNEKNRINENYSNLLSLFNEDFSISKENSIIVNDHISHNFKVAKTGIKTIYSLLDDIFGLMNSVELSDDDIMYIANNEKLKQSLIDQIASFDDVSTYLFVNKFIFNFLSKFDRLLDRLIDLEIPIYYRLKLQKRLLDIIINTFPFIKQHINYDSLSLLNLNDLDVLIAKFKMGLSNVEFQLDVEPNSLAEKHSLLNFFEQISLNKHKLKEISQNSSISLNQELPSFFVKKQFSQIKYDAETTKLRDVFIEEMKHSDFYTLPKISSLVHEKQNKIIDLIFENELPYCIALLDYLGFISHQYKIFRSKTKMFEEIARIFQTDSRSVKGNVNVLNDYSKENRERYTAHLHIEKVKKDYNNII